MCAQYMCLSHLKEAYNFNIIYRIVAGSIEINKKLKCYMLKLIVLYTLLKINLIIAFKVTRAELFMVCFLQIPWFIKSRILHTMCLFIKA